MAWRFIGTQFSLAARTGKCTVCGTDQKAAESGVFTTDVFITGEGDIEVCGQCIKEGADKIGWVDGARAAEAQAALQAEYDELKAWADDAYAELAAKDSTIDTLSTALGKTAGQRDDAVRALNFADGGNL